MSALLRDLRFALRTLGKSRAYACVSIITLAVAIGANTAIFSAVNRVLLKPLPFADPERLLYIYESRPELGMVTPSYPNYIDYREGNASFDDVGAVTLSNMTATGRGEPERLNVEWYSQNLLPMLGVAPALGRNFLPEEDVPNGKKAVLLSHGFWTRRFAADPEVIGSPITLDGSDWTIVGVMPPDFQFAFHVDKHIIAPLGTRAEEEGFRHRAAVLALFTVARLKDGVTLAQATEDMNALGDGLARSFPHEYGQARPVLADLHAEVTQQHRGWLMMMMCAVVFVLLIAIANVANLMLERAMRRQKEMSVRAALGAGRWRLIRQLLVESSLVALLSGGLGLLLALWGVDLLTAALPQRLGLGLFGPITIDRTVLIFTLLVASGTGLLFGLVPAVYASRQDLAQAMKEGDQRATSGSRHLRARSLLVVGEVALALMLLVAAGLTMRGLARLQAVDLGFDSTHVLTAAVPVTPERNATAAHLRMFVSELQRRVAALPGVTAVSVQMGAPFVGAHHDNFQPLDEPRPIVSGPVSVVYFVDVGGIEMLRNRLLAGRTFGAEDTPEAPPKVIIDKVLADKFFPGQDPVGQRLRDRLSEQPSVEIIGVVDHVKHYSLDDWEVAPYQMYYLYSQVPDKLRQAISGLTLLVRTQGEPGELAPQVRSAVAELDPKLAVHSIDTYEKIIGTTLESPRFVLRLLAIFAGLALLLAAVGLYAVMSNAVAQRTHELGLRLALGAQPQAVVALVVRQGARLIAIGLVVGIAGALALSRVLASMLPDLGDPDPLTFIAVTLILVVVGLTATYVPARRATRIDPMVVLRHD
ncbi:ABC transporter permease [Nannocystis radixulma]|uniref:ABC transporter permease n=1 Tax=Nannocystis radixulma TaxID=2995305 RepID=A0ABT5BJB0_9BACT|nr:ABC transporter permease [Nannocystis radixulma]MDC0674237.1 ABC transporter permease [Nannocystis radixulma]